MKDNQREGPIRKVIVNERGHYTITLPVDYMRSMGAKKGDRFKFIYQPKDLQSLNSITIVRMGCNAE